MPENFKKPYEVPSRAIDIDKLHEEQAHLKQAQQISKIDPKQNIFNAMSMFTVAMDFGLSLALPLLFVAFVGKWLNEKFDSQYFILIGLPIAFAVSSISIYKQIKKLQKNLKNKQ